MTTTPHANAHVRRQTEAHTMGKRAGYNHRMLRNNMDRPEAEWVGLLREIAVNPWDPGVYTENVTADDALIYARQWAQGFELGDHAAQGDLRRGRP